jgi:hypothetical protein
MIMTAQNSHEYINDFLYFIFTPDRSRDKGTYIYCSGFDFERFLPITKGRHRACANPVRRGLQFTNLGITSIALSKDATLKKIKGGLCKGVVPIEGSWVREIMLLENADELMLDVMIDYAVKNILQKMKNSLQLDDELPDKLLPPDELQHFLESLCNKYGE